MAGLVPAIHVLLAPIKERKTWMPATSAGMTSGESSNNSTRSAIELLGAQLARDAVEHGVDHADLLTLDKGVRHIDIFGDDDTRRHVAAVIELIGTGAQHRAQDRLDPLERPALREHVVDQRVERALLAHHPADDVTEDRKSTRLNSSHLGISYAV